MNDYLKLKNFLKDNFNINIKIFLCDTGITEKDFKNELLIKYCEDVIDDLEDFGNEFEDDIKLYKKIIKFLK